MARPGPFLLCCFRPNHAPHSGRFGACAPLSQAVEDSELPSIRAGRRPGEEQPELLRLDEAIQALSQIDPRKSRVIELRVFGGLSVDEAAEVLRISPPSVRRDWRLGKAWLTREMAKEHAMNRDLWQRVDALYHRALERDPDERGRFLDESCHGDEYLRREVESLLRHDNPTGDLLQIPQKDVRRQLFLLG